jgi:hypothetical protein
VPSTEFSVNPQTGNVIVKSPKEIGISNLVATLPNGVSVQLQGYQSHNSPDVIAAVAAANALMADKLIQAVKVIQEMAAKGAASGATGGVLSPPLH